MNPISAIFGSNISQSKRWSYFKDFASIVCSRESTYRTALDITAFDIPVMGAAAFRNFKNFLESGLECAMGTISVVTAPLITTFVGKAMGKFILPKEMQKDTLNYLRFSMSEVKSNSNFEKAAERVKSEEPEDKKFIASLYRRAEKKDKADCYSKQADEIETFCKDFKPSEEKRQLVYKLKKATIIGESFIEGGWWGSLGLILRWFRKNILNEDRFTGTKGYVSDQESEQIGDSGELNLFQKFIGVGTIFVSPLVNFTFLNKLEKSSEAEIENNRFLKIANEHLDMTHGVYPKLGLLFTFTTLPKWISSITLSQGWFERTERILKLCTVVSSWWLGHRVTNGTFAKHADMQLAKKHNTQGGVLVEPKYLEPNKANANTFDKISKLFPEPAKIQHVIRSTEGKSDLQNDAEDLHAKCLYKGFTLHSLLVLIINMGVNFTTKLRATHALGK